MFVNETIVNSFEKKINSYFARTKIEQYLSCISISNTAILAFKWYIPLKNKKSSNFANMVD